MTAAFEFRGEENVHHVDGNAGTGHTFAKADDVGVVVGAGIRGVELSSADRGANPGNAISGHAHAKTSTTDENAKRIFIIEESISDSACLDRIIAAAGIGGAQIMDIMPLILKVLNERILEVEATMIGSKVDCTHRCLHNAV